MNCQVSLLNTCGIETFKFTSCSATLTVSGTFCNTILVPLVIHLRFVCSSPRISPSQIKMTSACLTPNLPQIIDFKEDEGWSCKYNHRYNHSKLFSAYYNSTTTVRTISITLIWWLSWICTFSGDLPSQLTTTRVNGRLDKYTIPPSQSPEMLLRAQSSCSSCSWKYRDCSSTGTCDLRSMAAFSSATVLSWRNKARPATVSFREDDKA